MRYPFAPGKPLPAGGFGASLTCASDPPRVVLGEPDGIRLELASMTFSLDVDEVDGELELALGVRARRARAGALRGLAGQLPRLDARRLRSRASRSRSASALSNRTGLGVAAGVGFEVSLRPGLTIAGVSVDRVDLALRLDSGEAPEVALRAVAAISGALGPVSFAADALRRRAPDPVRGRQRRPARRLLRGGPPERPRPRRRRGGRDQRGRLPGHRPRGRPLRRNRRARAARRGHRRHRHPRHEDPGRAERLVAVPQPRRPLHRHPARVRLHAQRRRRARRDRPRPRRRRPRRGGAHRLARPDPVRREPDCRRGADPRRDRRRVPHGGRAVRVRPDREDRLGHARR